MLTCILRSPPTPSSSPLKEQKTTSIGFSVPEEESEASEDRSREPSVQIVDVGRRTFSIPDSPSSDEGFDSDDDSVEELSAADKSSTFTTPDHHAGSAGKGRGSQTTHNLEDGLLSHKTLKIACLLTNDNDQTKRAAGTSHFNPIELDNERARRQEEVMVEIDDDGPEVLPSKPAIFADGQAEVIPRMTFGHNGEPQLSLHVEHTVDAGDDSGDDVIPDSDIEHGLFDEDELYQLTEPQLNDQQHHALFGGVRVHKMVKFLDQDFDSEDSDDDDNEDEDEDDFLTHFNSDYQERTASLAEKTTSNPTTTSNSHDSFQLGTEQVDQEPLVLVEDSQLRGQMPPRISSSGVAINVEAFPAFLNNDHRAPSPSDAALVKKPSFSNRRLSLSDDIVHVPATSQMNTPKSTSGSGTGYLAGRPAPSGFGAPHPLRFDFLHNSNSTHGFANFDDTRGHESMFDDSDFWPRYKIGPFSSGPERCSALPSLLAACEQSKSNDLHVHQYLGPSASEAMESSTSSKDCIPARGAGDIDHQMYNAQRLVGPSPALSIKELVDDNHSELPSTSRCLKRKAEEITPDDEAMAPPPNQWTQPPIQLSQTAGISQESFLHDAQPRDIQASIPHDTVLQFGDRILDNSEPSTVSNNEEPARKKIKRAAKRPGRFGTFISGFVIGGLSLAGAFAAVVATVPNSVREEAWREFGYNG